MYVILFIAISIAVGSQVGRYTALIIVSMADQITKDINFET